MLNLYEASDMAVLTASGHLKSEDYETFIPIFEALVRRRGRIPLLIDLTGLNGVGIDAIWRDLKFDIGHRGDFGPMAIISDKAWHRWAIAVSRPFFSAKMRFFDADKRVEAEQWLRNQPNESVEREAA